MRLHAEEKMPDFRLSLAFHGETSVADMVKDTPLTVFWILRYLGCTLCSYDIQEIKREYQRSTHQYQYVTGGSGSSPMGRGNSVFTEALYDGEKGRFERREMLGVTDPDKLPEWAKTALEALKAEKKRDKEAR